MFNFLFDGKLGEILAPVTGTTNQFHLAIQHHKNVDVQNITISSTNIALDQLSESGIAPLHVACRYNNTFALELLLSKGARIDIRDSQGNTVLHYAAKYCHLELCKFLVAQRVPVPAKNSSNQTAYDVTDNHVIRQFLLPLQFQSEPSSFDGGYSTASNMSQYNSTIVNQQPVGGYPPAPSPLRQSGGGRNPHSAHSSPSAQPAGPFPGAVPPSASNLFGVRPPEPLQIPSINSNPSPNPPPSSYSAPMPPPVGPPHIAAAGLGFQQAPLLPPSASVQHSDTVISAPVPPPVQSYTPTSYMQPNQASMTNTRIIQPDGFHSSASDPVLQQKYGHIKDQVSIAPPPTASIPGAYPVYGMYTGASSAPGYNPGMQSVHSRYVGYDAVNNAPVAYQPTPPTENFNTYGGPPDASVYPPLSSISVPSVGPPSDPFSVPAPIGPPSVHSYAPSSGNISSPPTAMSVFDPATDVVSLSPSSRAVL